MDQGNEEESHSGSKLPHPGTTVPDHMKDPGGDSVGEDAESHTAQGPGCLDSRSLSTPSICCQPFLLTGGQWLCGGQEGRLPGMWLRSQDSGITQLLPLRILDTERLPLQPSHSFCKMGVKPPTLCYKTLIRILTDQAQRKERKSKGS